jgi:hypothetical protein
MALRTSVSLAEVTRFVLKEYFGKRRMLPEQPRYGTDTRPESRSSRVLSMMGWAPLL